MPLKAVQCVEAACGQLTIPRPTIREYPAVVLLAVTAVGVDAWVGSEQRRQGPGRHWRLAGPGGGPELAQSYSVPPHHHTPPHTAHSSNTNTQLGISSTVTTSTTCLSIPSEPSCGVSVFSSGDTINLRS